MKRTTILVKGSVCLAFVLFISFYPKHSYGQTACSLYEVSVACGAPGVLCNVPSPTYSPTPTLTPTPEPDQAWIKVRSTSFYSNNFSSGGDTYYVPNDPDPFRANPLPGETVNQEDQGDPYLMSTDPTTISINDSTRRAFETGVARLDGVSFDPARVNEKSWVVQGEGVRPSRLTPDTFLQYARSRKDTIVLDSNGTNFQTGITNGRVNIVNILVGETVVVTTGSVLEQSPYVLIVDGNLTISDNFNETLNSDMAIIVTGTLTFDADVTIANAIFFANEVSFPDGGSADADGLRINGNLIVSEGLPQSALQRYRSNNQQPVLFIMQNVPMYMNILPLFSVSNYEWQNVQ